MRLAGIVGLVGSALTLIVGLLLTYAASVAPGYAAAAGGLATPGAVVAPDVIQSLIIVVAGAGALPFASILLVGRGTRAGSIMLIIAGIVACAAQGLIALDVQEFVMAFLQPGALLVASGIGGFAKAHDRQAPQSA